MVGRHFCLARQKRRKSFDVDKPSRPVKYASSGVGVCCMGCESSSGQLFVPPADHERRHQTVIIMGLLMMRLRARGPSSFIAYRHRVSQRRPSVRFFALQDDQRDIASRRRSREHQALVGWTYVQLHAANQMTLLRISMAARRSRDDLQRDREVGELRSESWGAYRTPGEDPCWFVLFTLERGGRHGCEDRWRSRKNDSAGNQRP